MNFPVKVTSLENLVLSDREIHLAIGMFDGVHLGHQKVIKNAINRARAVGGIAGVLTFWPHPSWLFLPENPVPQIVTSETKEAVLTSLGVDLIIEQPFNREFAAIPAEDFVRHLREKLPQLQGIYIGENWRFGKGRTGDASFLIKLGNDAGITVISEPQLQLNGDPISSTRIRTSLRNGDLKLVNELLGYNYFTQGIVRGGKELGRTIGFPTLNFPWPATLLQPKFGVYAVQVSDSAKNGKTFPGVANFGLRPTVEKDPRNPVLEVFITAPSCPFSAGDSLRVQWHHFLRPEKKFANLDELKAEIARDVETARKFFSEKDA